MNTTSETTTTETTTTDTSRVHVYAGSGCVNQWKSDHDTKHCIATFRATN